MPRASSLNPRAALAFYGASGLAAAVGLLTPGFPGSALFHLGAGFATFLSAIGGAVFAYDRYAERLDELGRRGGAALLLAGLSAAVLTAALFFALRALVHAAPALPFGLLAATASVGATAGVLALSQPGIPVRLVVTLGAVTVAAGAMAWLASPVTAFVSGLGLYVLFLTWAGENPTPAAEDEEEPEAHVSS